MQDEGDGYTMSRDISTEEMYSRQTLLSQIGKEGQEKICKGTVLVVGVGALGTVASELLVRAGISRVLLVDRDVIEESNLQRQTLFYASDIGKSKAMVAKKRLSLINPKVEVKSYAMQLDGEKLYKIYNGEKFDLILDCTDNLQTRFIINDFCKKENLPWIYSAAIKTTGYVMPILPHGPCVRCFLQEASLETCSTAGVLNTITTSIAALQVTIGLKLLVGASVDSMLHYYDIWKAEIRKMNISKKENCSACNGEYDYLNKKQEVKKVKFCSSQRFQIIVREKSSQELQELAARLEKIDNVVIDEQTLLFKGILLFTDGRALVKSESEEEAISKYAKWIGE